MPDPVHGKNVALSMDVSGTFYPVLCATDTTFFRSVEFIEKTGPNSAGIRQWMERLEEFTSTVSGLTKINNDTSLTFFYMLQIGIRRDEQNFQLTFQDEAANLISIAGPGLIGNMSIDSATTDFSNAQIEIKWNDLPAIDTIPSPSVGTGKIVQTPLYKSTTPGATSVSDALLTASGVEILQVRRTGTQDDPAVSPVDRQFKFTAGTGTISFDPSIPFNAGEIIYILYQK